MRFRMVVTDEKGDSRSKTLFKSKDWKMLVTDLKKHNGDLKKEILAVLTIELKPLLEHSIDLEQGILRCGKYLWDPEHKKTAKDDPVQP